MSSSRRCHSSRARKNGPPTTDMATPGWMGAGSPSTRRMPRSTASMNTAPNSRLSGISAPWRLPTSRRTRCGTIRPTKLICPATATAADAASDAAVMHSQRTRPVATPSAAASSSPDCSRSSSQATKGTTDRARPMPAQTVAAW